MVMKIQNILLVIFLLSTPSISYGYTFTLDNDNIVDATHPKPENFGVNEKGETFGETEDLLTFSQKNIDNDVTRLQRFEIQDAWWYISDKGLIGYGQSLSDLEALSIYLALPEVTA